MMRHKRIVAALAVAMLLAANVSYAWVQFLAPIGSGIMWLGCLAASNVSMARAVEWSIYAHGAVIGFFAWKNANDSAETSTPIKARLVVEPMTSAKRDNPDPTKFDDATVRDPTPKSSYDKTTGLSSPPASTANGVWSAQGSLGSGSTGLYKVSNGSNVGVRHIYLVRAGTTMTSAAPLAQCNAVYPGAPYLPTPIMCNAEPGVSGQPWPAWAAFYYDDYADPAGYSCYGANCNLVDASKVMKPAGKLPCEVIRNADGTWDVDGKNPECAGLGTALSTAGTTVSYSRGSGDFDAITSNADGGLTVSTRGPGGNRDIATGPYSSSQGGFPIVSVTDSPGGGGTTPGTGTSSGGQTCGGAGQPECAVAVNDTGFQGKDGVVVAKADAAIAKLDERVTQVQGVNDNSTFGVDTSWIPSLKPGPVVACQNIQWQPGITHGPLAGVNGSASIDWCGKVGVIREYLAWLFGIAAVVGIALLFFGSNKSGADK